MPNITPFLWFDNNAEEAAQFYTSIFKNSRMRDVRRYGDGGPGPKGTAMTVSFSLEGQEFTALNGGPLFKFNESISFVVHCKTQEEVDYFWDKLSEGGDKKAQQCGWLTDKYGASWQVVPRGMAEMMTGDPQKVQRAFKAMLQMKKLDIAELKRAYAG